MHPHDIVIAYTLSLLFVCLLDFFFAFVCLFVSTYCFCVCFSTSLSLLLSHSLSLSLCVCVCVCVEGVCLRKGTTVASLAGCIILTIHVIIIAFHVQNILRGIRNLSVFNKPFLGT